MTLAQPGLRVGQRRAARQYPAVTPLADIVITSPPTAAFEAGVDTYQFAAEQVGQPVRVVDPDTGQVTVQRGTVTGYTEEWFTSNAAVATISSTGLLTAVGVGSCDVTVRAAGVTSAPVTVTVVSGAPPVVDTVTVTPGTFTVLAGATTPLTAAAADASANAILGRTVAWSTSNGAVATVDASTGVVTGVAAGSCTITATVDGVGGTSACTVEEVPTGTMRTYADSEWQFLIGPQVAPGNYNQPGASWMEANLTNRLPTFAANAASFNNFITTGLTGTLSLTNGSSAVVGVGTNLTTLVGQILRVPDATYGPGYRYFRLNSASDAENGVMGGLNFGSGTYVPRAYEGPTATGLSYAKTNPATQFGNLIASDMQGTLNYYDTIFCAYQAWSKVDNMSGASGLLTQARALGEDFADTPDIGDWSKGDVPYTAAPRLSALWGWMCRAKDQRSEYWTKLDTYVTQQAETNGYLSREITGGSRGAKPSVYSPRECGYLLQFTAALGACHPNTTRRTYHYNKAILYAKDIFARKAVSMGTGLGTIWWTTSEGNTPHASNGTTSVDYCQPFLNSLVIEGLIATHRMMRKNGVTSGTDYDTIGSCIVEACRGWWTHYRDASKGFNANVRSQPYYVGLSGQKINGVTMTNLTNAPGWAVAPQPTTWDSIVSDRQLNADGLGNLGYAFAISGETVFVDAHNEVLDSCFGAGWSINPTRYSSLWYGPEDGAPAGVGTQKNWNQHHRQGQRGMAWIVGGLETF